MECGAMDAEFMESYYRTYNSEDPEALRAYYADDVVMVSAAGETHGADAILDSYRYLISVFHDKMTAEHIEIDGDSAVVSISDRFTAKTAVPDFFGQSFAVGDEFELRLRGTYQSLNGRFTHITIETPAG